MQFEVGKIYDGIVKGITTYGAFVELDQSTTGMVHISEIHNSYVNDIKDHLTENQSVKVKIIGVNEAGKISLSIKKAVDPEAEGSAENNNSGGNSNYRGGNNSSGGNSNYRGGNNSSGGNSNYRGGGNSGGGNSNYHGGGNSGSGSGGGGNFGGGNRRPRQNVWEPKKQVPMTEMTFEDKLSKFKQNSEEKMGELKRNIDNKRKGSSRRGK
ncbi:MAG TPA: S1 RNA-binding domain-containing protein [Clostridiales bacterium]|nr:S1 RNA-binding domain-containing protein [Clostridiales bacterium]